MSTAGKEIKPQRPLPPTNSDFYQLAETLPQEELATLKQVRSFMGGDQPHRIDGQRLYNLVIHNNYAAHSIAIDVKGKGFQFYTFTFG